MKIHDIILEREGSLSGGGDVAVPPGTPSGGTAGNDTGTTTAAILGAATARVGGIPGAAAAVLGGAVGGIPGAIGAVGAVALYKKMRGLPVEKYDSPELKAAYSARDRLLAQSADIKQTKAELALNNEMLAKLNQSKTSAGTAPTPALDKQIAKKTADIKQQLKRISKLEKKIPYTRTEVEVARTSKTLLNPKDKKTFNKAVKPQLKTIDADHFEHLKTKYMSGWSRTAMFIGNAIGLITPLIQMYSQYDDINVQQLSPAETTQLKSEAWAQFEAQLMVLAVKWVGEARTVTWIAQILLRVAGGVSAFATVGTSLAVTVTAEVIIDSIVYFLGTEDGKKWLVSVFSSFVKSGGKWPESIWADLSHIVTTVKAGGQQPALQ